MKVCPARAELLRANGRTDRHNEAYSRFLKILRTFLTFENKLMSFIGIPRQKTTKV